MLRRPRVKGRRNFNPRAPCGARRSWKSLTLLEQDFNPRAPCGARRIRTSRVLSTLKFQPTRPLRGATQMLTDDTAQLLHFNPRAPCGARPWEALCHSGGRPYFNPRAPCGARLMNPMQMMGAMIFQPTRPLRGATCCARTGNTSMDFNPRAPCGARHERRE